MKTKDLIQLLNKADPSGELHCCIGSRDIYNVRTLPGYYDGSRLILERDEKRSHYYNVVAAEYTGKGEKVDIVSLGLGDIIHNNIAVPVKTERSIDEERVQALRHEARKVKKELNDSSLVEVMRNYKDGWRAAQSANTSTAKLNEQWWQKPGHEASSIISSRSAAPGDIILSQGESRAIVKSGFFAPVKDGKIIIWRLSI